jgi:hypothetical protein
VLPRTWEFAPVSLHGRIAVRGHLAVTNGSALLG